MTKDANVKAFNMVTRINEVIKKCISWSYKYKFDSTACNSNQNGIIIDVNVSKRYHTHKKIIVRILGHVFKRIVGI